LSLKYTYEFLDAKPDLTPKQKELIENDIKSFVSLMHFIN
jgi:hypothetical protein